MCRRWGTSVTGLLQMRVVVEVSAVGGLLAVMDQWAGVATDSDVLHIAATRDPWP